MTCRWARCFVIGGRYFCPVCRSSHNNDKSKYGCCCKECEDKFNQELEQSAEIFWDKVEKEVKNK